MSKKFIRLSKPIYDNNVRADVDYKAVGSTGRGWSSVDEAIAELTKLRVITAGLEFVVRNSSTESHRYRFTTDAGDYEEVLNGESFYTKDEMSEILKSYSKQGEGGGSGGASEEELEALKTRVSAVEASAASFTGLLQQMQNRLCIDSGDRREYALLVTMIDARTAAIIDVGDEYGSTALDNKKADLTDAEDALLAYLNNIITYAPCFLKDATNVPDRGRVLDFTSGELENAVYEFEQQYAEYLGLMIRYVADNIGTQAAQAAQSNAEQYVNEHINEILEATTKEEIEQWIRDYADGKFVAQSTYEATEESLKALTTWIESDGLTIGGTGLITKMKDLFVGTNSITFDESGNIVNISQSGLVTSTNFASIFAQSGVGDDYATRASISAFITTDDPIFDEIDGKISETNKAISNVVVTADRVVIISGKSEKDGVLSYNFYLDGYGNVIMQDLWAQDIYVEGVIINKVNVIDVENDKNVDKLIKDENDTDDDLDIMMMGDIIQLKSNNGRSMWLPYYIKENQEDNNRLGNKRTYTMYGGYKHKITPTELKQMVGRRVTLYMDVDDNKDNGQYLYGCCEFSLHGISGDYDDAVNQMACGMAWFDEPNVAEITGARIQARKVVHLEFKVVNVYNSTTKKTYPAYIWTKVEDTDVATGVDYDEEWMDEEE